MTGREIRERSRERERDDRGSGKEREMDGGCTWEPEEEEATGEG